jgi:hypothetical protein
MFNLTIIIVGALLYLIIFMIYLELNPKIGNVWYRIGSDGKKHINLSSLYNLIVQPLYSIDLWYPSFWDLNYFVGTFFTILILNYATK